MASPASFPVPELAPVSGNRPYAVPHRRVVVDREATCVAAAAREDAAVRHEVVATFFELHGLSRPAEWQRLLAADEADCAHDVRLRLP
jgi:hypothetical protein